MAKSLSLRKKSRLEVLTYQDKTIISAAALAALLCFAFAWSLGGQYYELMAYAQDAPAGVPISEILAQVNTTVIAISTLVTTAGSIIVGVLAWIRARTGDRIVSDQANEWFQFFYEQLRQTDEDIRQYITQALEKGAEFDVVLEVLKKANPDFAKAWDQASPEVKKRLQQIEITAENWQEELNKIYEVSPKTDPVRP